MKLIFKYIVINSGAILFNENTIHSIVAKGFMDVGMKIYSAGFVKLEYEGISQKPTVTSYGNSDSLKIESRPELDNIVIADLFEPISKIKYNLLFVNDIYGTE